LVETGAMLDHAGYQIRSLNLINFAKSMHYNPFMYIRSEKDILKLVNTIIANTKGYQADTAISLLAVNARLPIVRTKQE